MNIVLFGGPGSGKGTQSEKLIEKYGLHHISTGEVLREHIRKETDLGKIAKSYIDEGQLIPDDLMIQILDSVLEEAKDKPGVIFDGFPRTIPQAEALNKLLEKRGKELHAVVGLEVPDDELVKRMINRGKMTGRADDNEDTIKKRLNVYHKQTSPLKDHYKKQNKYISIDGNKEIEHIFDTIVKELENKK
ncbi:MAG: adenylate kinase [Muribaculaceae bacterium]|nr:adenylate kinase [Muribaculaceae bacterium]